MERNTNPQAMGHKEEKGPMVGIEGTYRSLGLSLDLRIEPIPGVTSIDPRDTKPTHDVYARFAGSNDEFCLIGSGWQREITAKSARVKGGMLVSMALEDPAFNKVIGSQTLRISAFPEAPMSPDGVGYTIRADRPRQQGAAPNG